MNVQQITNLQKTFCVCCFYYLTIEVINNKNRARKKNGSAAGGLPAMLRKAIAGGGHRAGVASPTWRGGLTT